MPEHPGRQMTDAQNIVAARRSVRVAAVQIEGRAGDLAHNLRQAEALAADALARGAKIVALPEFFTTPCYVHPRIHEAIVGIDNPAKDMLVRLARQHGAYVGGSMLMRRGQDVYNTYCLAGPDGRVQMHDKDQPTMWENCYYVAGNDDGVVETDYGAAGLAVCWELVRWRTIKRFPAVQPLPFRKRRERVCALAGRARAARQSLRVHYGSRGHARDRHANRA